MSAIYYGLTNIMMPLALIGTQVGAFLYLLLPAMIINIILTLLLLWLWVKSCRKMFSIIKKEREDEAKKEESVKNENISAVAKSPEEQ